MAGGLHIAPAPGEILLVESVDGRGKTSLLRMSAGLPMPVEGMMSRHDVDIQADQPRNTVRGVSRVTRMGSRPS